jgi:DNA-binding NtrC family response regulator
MSGAGVAALIVNTIFVIEDVEMIRTTVRMVLTRAGFKVLLAGSVVEAQQVWREHQHEIDVIITDNSLPDGSGIELVKAFEDEKPGLKIIVASGLIHGELPPHYFQLHKPFNSKFLLALVKGALDQPEEG